MATTKRHHRQVAADGHAAEHVAAAQHRRRDQDEPPGPSGRHRRGGARARTAAETSAAQPQTGSGRATPESALAVSQTDLERAVARLVRHLARRPSRRRKEVERARRLAPAGSMRRMVRWGGWLVQPSWSRPRPARPRMVLLCDVSRSMERHATFVLQFAHSLHRVRLRTESFLFSTEICRGRPYFRRWPVAEALRRLQSDFAGWSGRTHIGECLEMFADDYGRTVLGRRSLLIVVSDGIDVGRAECLTHAMERLTRQCRHIVWLNPISSGSAARDPPAVAAVRQRLWLVAPLHAVGAVDALAYRLRRATG